MSPSGIRTDLTLFISSNWSSSSCDNIPSEDPLKTNVRLRHLLILRFLLIWIILQSSSSSTLTLRTSSWWVFWFSVNFLFLKYCGLPRFKISMNSLWWMLYVRAIQIFILKFFPILESLNRKCNASGSSLSIEIQWIEFGDFSKEMLLESGRDWLKINVLLRQHRIRKWNLYVRMSCILRFSPIVCKTPYWSIVERSPKTWWQSIFTIYNG